MPVNIDKKLPSALSPAYFSDSKRMKNVNLYSEFYGIDEFIVVTLELRLNITFMLQSVLVNYNSDILPGCKQAQITHDISQRGEVWQQFELNNGDHSRLKCDQISQILVSFLTFMVVEKICQNATFCR